jgi:hypothetical protein
MSQFEDLIREWDEMMCMESDAASLEEHEISFAQEQRILDLTAEYIHKLGGIQKESDHRGSQFADRLLRTVNVGERDRDQVREICQRFLSSVGMIFRDEISRDLPRAKRLAARQFVIDWSTGDFLGRWPDLSVEFSIRDSLVYCVEHIAGAEEKIGEAMVSLYLAELWDGNVRIPRLTLKAKVASSLIFQWEDGSISIDTKVTEESKSVIEETELQRDECFTLVELSSPILAYFRDRLEGSQRRLSVALLNKSTRGNPHVKTLEEVDRIELNDNDPSFERVRRFVNTARNRYGIEVKLLLDTLAETSYYETAEAIAVANTTAIVNRSKVVKSVNRLKQIPSLIGQ